MTIVPGFKEVLILNFFFIDMPIYLSKGVKMLYITSDSVIRTIIKQNLGNKFGMHVNLYTIFISSSDNELRYEKKLHVFIGPLFPFVIVFVCRQFDISLSSIKIRNLPQSHPTFESFLFSLNHTTHICYV